MVHTNIEQRLEDAWAFGDTPDTSQHEPLVPTHAKTGHHQMLNIDSLVPFYEHPFKLYEGKRLNDLVASVRENGVLSPVLVRYIKRSNSKFEILSGHNRINAAKIAGFKQVPAIVNNELTDGEAMLIVTETNLVQRSFGDLSHSERAICLVQHYNALKRQGQRSDLISEIEALLDPENTSSETQTKSRSDKVIADKYNLSRDKVAKYIRLATLTPALLGLTDNGKLGFNSAYQLSFIEDATVQNRISELVCNGRKINTKKAEFCVKDMLKEFYQWMI